MPNPSTLAMEEEAMTVTQETQDWMESPHGQREVVNAALRFILAKRAHHKAETELFFKPELASVSDVMVKEVAEAECELEVSLVANGYLPVV